MGDKRSAETGEQVAAAACQGVSGRSPDHGGFVTIPDLFRNCLTNPYLVQTPCQPACRSPLGRIAVAGRGIEDMTRKHPKTEFVGIRMSLVDVEALRAEAGQCGMTMSEPVPRRTTGQLVTSRTDQDTAASIDRLGRMLKYLYLKDKRWASPEDGSVVRRIPLCHRTFVNRVRRFRQVP